MKYIKNFRLFENNSLDLIEGELEDIEILYLQIYNNI